MIRLDATTRKLQALLGGAVATTQLDVVVSYSDKTSTSYNGGTTAITTNDTTAVDICAAPGASTIRDVDYVNIRNNDTASAVVTVQYNDNGTVYKLASISLGAGERLTYTHAQGWAAYGTDGGTKVTSATTLPTMTSAELAAAVTDETGSGALVFADSPTLISPALGTPTSGNLTNCSGLPAAGVAGTALVAAAIGVTVQAYDADLTTWAGVTPGTGVATALAVNVGSAGAPVVLDGALGTPSSGTLTNATGLPAAGVTGTALVAAAIGTTVQAYDADLTTWAGVTPGTGVATALAVNVGSAGAVVTFNGAGGTPASGNLANCTGYPGTSLTVIDAKGDLLVGTADNTAGRVAIGANGTRLAADSSQTAGLIWTSAYDRPNLLINPNWQIDQINEGALYTVNGASAVQGPDGWSGNDGNGAGVFKLRTVADPDNAALNCLEITCTTADASIAAGDLYRIFTAVEGYDAAALQFGTSGAAPLTLQFKFKTSVTGVYGVSLYNSAANRFYPSYITVSDTNENEYSVTLTADTTGTWLYTNGVGLYLQIVLAAGSTYHGTANAWTGTGSPATTSSQCNFMSSNTNVAYLKRIQLIPGSQVQAYKPADIQKELAKCQRYYEKSFDQGVAVAQNAGTAGVACAMSPGTAAGMNFAASSYKAEKRAASTITFYNPSAANAFARDIQANVDCTATSSNLSGTRSFQIAATTGAGSGITNRVAVHWTANARIS